MEQKSRRLSALIMAKKAIFGLDLFIYDKSTRRVTPGRKFAFMNNSQCLNKTCKSVGYCVCKFINKPKKNAVLYVKAITTNALVLIMKFSFVY